MDENRYFGMRDGAGGYDVLILQKFEGGGLTPYYMSRDGWVEENALIFDLHDAGTVPVDEATARAVSMARFSQPLQEGQTSGRT
jgi:hypothetical protein